MSSDAELLQAFIDTRSEPAFAALVQRHLPLVYAVAWRHVGDAHRAHDVAQTVFTLLARKAHTLRGHPTIAGWLHTTTHYAAAKFQRAEQRRLRRETDALAMQNDSAPNSPQVAFERIRPVIDDALTELKEADRTAVLLRYFDNHSYAVIGAQLGVSENTVRMRVERSLERLRLALSRRGVDSTVAAIGIALGAQTAGAVPAGLAATISSSALTMSAGGGLVFLMSTTFLKYSAIALVVVAGGTGLLLQQRQIETLRAENARLIGASRQPIAIPAATMDPTEVARLRTQVAQLKGSPASSWQERAGLLREMLAQLPGQNIPEIAFASEDDWLDAAKPKLETADDYRRAFATLRDLAIDKFTAQLEPALRAYLAAHGGKFPSDVSELQAHLNHAVDDAIWRRYIVTTADTVSNVRMGGQWIITQGAVVDPAFDSEFVVGPNGRGKSTFGVSSMMELRKAYRQANGKDSDDLVQLLPYATTQRQQAAVLARIEQRQADRLATGK